MFMTSRKAPVNLDIAVNAGGVHEGMNEIPMTETEECKIGVGRERGQAGRLLSNIRNQVPVVGQKRATGERDDLGDAEAV